jgi:hypothetical protein
MTSCTQHVTNGLNCRLLCMCRLATEPIARTRIGHLHICHLACPSHRVAASAKHRSSFARIAASGQDPSATSGQHSHCVADRLRFSLQCARAPSRSAAPRVDRHRAPEPSRCPVHSLVCTTIRSLLCLLSTSARATLSSDKLHRGFPISGRGRPPWKEPPIDPPPLCLGTKESPISGDAIGAT